MRMPVLTSRRALVLVAAGGALAPAAAYADTGSGIGAAGLNLLSTISQYYQSSDILPSIGYWFGVTVLIGAAFYMARRLIHAI